MRQRNNVLSLMCDTCKQRFGPPFGRDLTSPTLRNTSRIGVEGMTHGTLLACECGTGLSM